MEIESTPDSNDAKGSSNNNNSENNAAKKKKSPRFALTIDVDVKHSASASTTSGRSTGENTPVNYDGTKIPFKPALKSASSMDADDDTDDDDTDNNNNNSNSAFNNPKKKKKSKKKNRTLKWDEAKIEEHDKLRGTRMKIEEPNTPFAAASYYDSGSETDCSMTSRGNNSVSSANANSHNSRGISWDALTNKLEAHAAVAASLSYPPSSPSSHGGDRSDDRGNCTTEDEEELSASAKRERQRREMRRLEFQEHRKRHYNEMEVVRRFRREHPDGEPSHNGHSSANSSVTHGTDVDSDDDDDDENE